MQTMAFVKLYKSNITVSTVLHLIAIVLRYILIIFVVIFIKLGNCEADLLTQERSYLKITA